MIYCTTISLISLLGYSIQCLQTNLHFRHIYCLLHLIHLLLTMIVPLNSLYNYRSTTKRSISKLCTLTADTHFAMLLKRRLAEQMIGHYNLNEQMIGHCVRIYILSMKYILYKSHFIRHFPYSSLSLRVSFLSSIGVKSFLFIVF